MENMLEITVIGNLGRDAEGRYTPNGTFVATTSIAVDMPAAGGETRTEWVKVNVWGKRGEALAEHLTKGKAMLFRGRPTVEAWEGEDGKTRKQLVVNIGPNDLVRFLSNGKRQPDLEPATEEEIPF